MSGALNAAAGVTLRCPDMSCSWFYRPGLDDPVIVVEHLAEHRSQERDDPQPARPAVPVQQLTDVPFERVRQALKDLLDVDDLHLVREARIGVSVVEVTLFALDGDGRKYMDHETRQPAVHKLVRKVTR